MAGWDGWVCSVLARVVHSLHRDTGHRNTGTMEARPERTQR